MAETQAEVTITVNGVACSMAGASVHTTALDWLREQGLTGAKEGCAEGECGACSIMVARPLLSTSATDDVSNTQWTAINACLISAASLDGQEVVTSEGLGTADNLHPVQREMAARGGSQCGYCTPGFICSMAAEFYRSDRVASPEGEEPCAEHGVNGFDLHALSGNLCRCTGYRPIQDAAYALGEPAADDAYAVRRGAPAPAPASTKLSTPTGDFTRPSSLSEALEALTADPDATLVAGSTDVGVEVNIRGLRATKVIAIDRLSELRTFEFGDDSVEIGAALTLSEVERLLAGRIPLLSAVFPQFASRLIRNSATIGGNLGTGSPIGDLPPALLALEATLVLASSTGDRTVNLADYFTGYRQSVKRPGELIRAIRIPRPLAEITAFHKIAKRRYDDISSVAVGFALDVVDGEIVRARIGLGGVAATPLRALKTEAALEGQPWTADTAATAAAVMRTEGTPLDDHRASAAYRTAMLGTALMKLHAETVMEASR